MGFDWSKDMQACLVSWVATGNDADAKSAIVFFTALLNDLDHIGDGKGGERAVRRDTGYAVRSLPVYTALAYDWLHDHPAMTPDLRANALARFEQWLTFYMKEGYHRRSPGTNYHAGYTIAATFVAIAIAGDAPRLSDKLWPEVVDTIWGTDMVKAMGPGGVLDGGDFPEGWQYGPLSVMEYALAARVAKAHGVPVPAIDRWLTSMLVRSEYGTSEHGTTFALGDTETATPTIPNDAKTFIAMLVGDAPPEVWALATGELHRFQLDTKEWPLYDALAAAREAQPREIDRNQWPLSYFTPGPSVLYARTSWRSDAIWLAAVCAHGMDVDHAHMDAGNFVVTRGKDEVIVDPSPYGSLSSLTGNAPTVDSKHFPSNYHPSQAGWSEDTHFLWLDQTRSGIVAARCDYADQYRFQERASDVPFAQRDLVVVPWKGTDASVVVVDRAEADTSLYLRFRAPAKLTANGADFVTTVGSSTLTIHRVRSSGGTPEVRAIAVGECYDSPRTCEAARFPSGEYRLVVPGPKMEAIHVLDVAGKADLAIDASDQVVHLRRAGADAYVALPDVTTYKAGPGTQVVLRDGTATAAKSGDACDVTIGPGGSGSAAPLVFTLDTTCAIKADDRIGPATPNLDGTSSLVQLTVPPSHKTGRRGSCSIVNDPASPLLVGFVAFVLRRKRQSRRARSAELAART